MKILILFFTLFLTSCDFGGGAKPSRFYIKEVSLSTSEKTQLDESLTLLNHQGTVLNYGGGDRPLVVKSASLPGTTMSRSTPRTYECLIELDTSNGVIQSDPRILRYIFAHAVGHCYGLPYSNDPNDIMYYSLITTWSPALEDKIKDLGTKLFMEMP